MGSGKSGNYSNTVGNLKPSYLMEELKKSGEKFIEEDIVMITKQSNGKLAWLEKGNEGAGLKHILKHEKDFSNKGISKSEIVPLLAASIKSGKLIGTQGKKSNKPRQVYEVNFNGKVFKIAISIGSNGFIVGANPK